MMMNNDGKILEILQQIQGQISGIDSRLGGIDSRLDGIDSRLDKLEQRQVELKHDLDDKFKFLEKCVNFAAKDAMNSIKRHEREEHFA